MVNYNTRLQRIGTGQMGAPAGSRQVMISGFGNLTYFRNDDQATQIAKQRFLDDGFDINSFEITYTGTPHPWAALPIMATLSLLGMSRSPVSIRISANVLNNYSAQEVLNRAVAILSGWRLTIGVTDWQAIDSLRLEVQDSLGIPANNSIPNQSGNTITNQVPYNPNLFPYSPKPSGTNLLDSFALGLGISTPVAMILIVGGAYLLLRR